MAKTMVAGFLWVIGWLMLCTSPVLANDSPSHQAGAEKQQSAIGDDAESLRCDSVTSLKAKIDQGSLVQDAGYGLEHKKWSPEGSPIQFTIRRSSGIPAHAWVLVCFRWTSRPSNNQGNGGTVPLDFKEGNISQLDLSSDQRQLSVTVTVPDLGLPPSDVRSALAGWKGPWVVVPLAEVRILATDTNHGNNLDDGNNLDVRTEIGISYPIRALVFSIIVMILGFVILYLVTGPQANRTQTAARLLQAISTKDGYASLSQLQVLLWTFVVAISAIYVMSLSGQLVQITSGTLILLGIVGAAALGAAIHNEAHAKMAAAAPAHTQVQNGATQGAVEAKTATGPEEVPGLTQKQRAEIDAQKLQQLRIPQWSDLLINQVVTDKGIVMREIDVTRFQMLLFTLITAVFVLITVATTYVIPEIPSGFVTLMGISNSVYLGSKIIQS